MDYNLHYVVCVIVVVRGREQLNNIPGSKVHISVFSTEIVRLVNTITGPKHIALSVLLVIPT